MLTTNRLHLGEPGVEPALSSKRLDLRLGLYELLQDRSFGKDMDEEAIGSLVQGDSNEPKLP